jgi:hypothetical protein
MDVTYLNSIKDDDIVLWAMVFNATFNNISVISWRSVFLVEETGVPGENHRPRVHLTWAGFEHTLVMVGTDYIGSNKSNYIMIMTTTAPAMSCRNYNTNKMACYTACQNYL